MRAGAAWEGVDPWPSELALGIGPRDSVPNVLGSQGSERARGEGGKREREREREKVAPAGPCVLALAPPPRGYLGGELGARRVGVVGGDARVARLSEVDERAQKRDEAAQVRDHP